MNKSILMVMFSLALIIGQSGAIVWFDDGLIHNIDYVINEEVQVWDNPVTHTPTTVNLLSGGQFTNGLSIDMNSKVLLDGGIIKGEVVNVYKNAVLSILNGRVHNYRINIYDNSTFDMYNGEISGIWGYNDSKIDIYGGNLVGARSYDNAQIIITDGDIVGSIYCNDHSSLNMSGGILGQSLTSNSRAKAYITGGIIPGFNVIDDGQITIAGDHFAIDGEYFGYGVLSDDAQGRLTGRLLSGEMLDAYFNIDIYDNSRIILIPEPATISLLVLGGLFCRRRG